MTTALLYLIVCTWKNRVLARIRRLRQPKYLLSALAGVVYLYFLFFHRLESGGVRTPAAPVPFSADILRLAEWGFALLLLGSVLLPWVSPSAGKAPLFTQAEIQFLLPAPLSRNELLRFCIVKRQTGIIFGALISVIIFGAGKLWTHEAYLFITLWIIYTLLAIYQIGVYLVKASLADHGVSGYKRQGWILAVLAAILLSTGAWIKWFVPALPLPPQVDFQSLLSWLLQIMQTGPVYYLLLPFRALVLPAFAGDPSAFLRSLVPAFIILILTFIWVERTDVRFEEASLERSERVASMLDLSHSGRIQPRGLVQRKSRRPPIQLGAKGFPAAAIFWKNLISTGRFGTARIPAILAVVAGIAVMSMWSQGQELLPATLGIIAATFAGFFAFFGPIIIRNDLRIDLLHVDLMKSYPIPGWNLLLGEILAPLAILTCIEWSLLIVAIFTFPEMGNLHWSTYQRLMAASGAAQMLPCFSLIGILIQNAAALLMPGWAQLGKERQRGIEAMGQRLISMFGGLLVLLLAVIPGGMVFLASFAAGYWLVGFAVLPISAFMTCLVLLSEAVLGIIWLGRFFDKFDASLELDTLEAS